MCPSGQDARTTNFHHLPCFSCALNLLYKFPNLTFCGLTQAIVIAATRLRGSSNLGLIDALHLATAVAAGCQVFITNDAAIDHPDAGLDIWMLTDIEN